MSQSNPYQAKKLQAAFTDIDGAPTNPSSIQLSIYRAYGGEITLIDTKAAGDMQHPTTGTYYYVFTPGANGPGIYTARWITGDGVDVQESWHVAEGASAS